MSRGGVCTVLTLALLGGCRPRPSPEYEEAHQRFITLYAVHLDAAYARPEMDQVVSLLQAVPPKSLDAPEARTLLARIQAGRAQLAAEEEARRALVRQMLLGPPEAPDVGTSGAARADAGPAAVLAVLDVGAGDAGLDAGPRRARVPSACAPTALRLLLPFESRDTAFVSQGNNGRFTHQGASRFAFDFNVAIGTAVVAAAPGVVLQTQDMFDRSVDMDPDQYNFVLLDHGNGVLTEYGHLRHHGTRVRPAQRVAQGELIGYSGDTGMSTGPHLHFAVEDASLQSQPACFLDVESGVPRAGEVVRSGNVAGVLLPGEFRLASLPTSAFASQEIALESELPLLLPDAPVEIRGRVLAPSREVILWVRPQGAKEPSRRQVVPLDAEGRFHLLLPLEGLDGIHWIGFTRVQPKGAWKGWALRRFDVSREASRAAP
jgi:murein DD-endopeptidase MepM/ murein hydrolase activator NlpD